MSYEEFFGLNEAPFSLAPNPRYLFESASHTAALGQLAYAIERREALIVMTGEIGTGKTLLCRAVLERLDRKTFVSVINDPLLEPEDLLTQMLQDFGVMSTDRTAVRATSRHDLFHALEDFLSSLIALDAHAVVIIDEAQHVRPHVLEQIRLLSNIDAPGSTMLQIVLAGQLDMESLLARPELRQVQQRVSRRIRLEPLGEDELRSYIEHRLAVGRAAGSRMPGASELARALNEWEGVKGSVTFAPDAVQMIWRWSGGLPRLINLLCDRALEAAYARRLRTIDGDLVDTAAIALGLHSGLPVGPAASMFDSVENDVPSIPEHVEPIARSTWTPARGIAAAIALIIVAAAAAWFATRTPARGVNGAVTAPVAGSPATAAPPVAPSTPPPSSPPSTLPAPERATAPAAAATPDAISPAFEILVASFRTEARAAAVAAQVSDAGLKVRQRGVGGWQQVIAGPFASREEADAGRQRLEGAGLAGTQIVLAGR